MLLFGGAFRRVGRKRWEKDVRIIF